MRADSPAGAEPRPPRLRVEGRGTILEGVRRHLERGQVLVVGRSRSCDISLRKTPGFLGHPDPVRLLASQPFNRVSRVHCEIHYLPDGRVEVRDLSRNGTWVDGERVARSRLVSPGERRVRVRLCDDTWGELHLALEDDESA